MRAIMAHKIMAHKIMASWLRPAPVSTRSRAPAWVTLFGRARIRVGEGLLSGTRLRPERTYPSLIYYNQVPKGALRRLGTAAPLLRRGPPGVPDTALDQLGVAARTATAGS
jgi:hypothetical protein